MTSLVIPLSAIPNQSFSVRLDTARFVLTIKEVMGMMAVTVERNNVLVVSGWRAVSGSPVIPFEYLEDGSGNFIFTTSVDEEIPYYTNFGSTCSLVWTSQDELDGYRND